MEHVEQFKVNLWNMCETLFFVPILKIIINICIFSKSFFKVWNKKKWDKKNSSNFVGSEMKLFIFFSKDWSKLNKFEILIFLELLYYKYPITTKIKDNIKVKK